MKNFKEWLEDNEKNEVFGIFGKIARSSLGAIGQLAGQATNIPGPDELGIDTSGVKDVAKQMWDTYGDKFKPLTPEQLATLNNNCFNKKQQAACETLCSKKYYYAHKAACKMAGMRQLGRGRWVPKDPLRRYR